MNWKLIAALSLFGLAMGGATISLVPARLEPFCWLIIFLICAVLIARAQRTRHFLHGLCVSLLNSVWITCVHVLFFDAYVANHPTEAAMLVDAPLPGRAMMVLTGPLIGLLSGVVLGFFASAAARFIKPPPGS